MAWSSNRQELEASLAAHGLRRVAAPLAALARPGTRLAHADEHDGTQSTRLGGDPSLPPEAAWPTWRDGQPLAFLAQVDLADVARSAAAGVLPRNGLLLFFYDVVAGTWGFAPDDAGSAAVVHVADAARTVRRTPPPGVPAEGRFPEVALRPRPELSLPPLEDAAVERLQLTDTELDAFDDWREQVQAGEPPVHRLLGHCDPVQGDMQLQCQLVTNGLYCGDGSGYQHPRARALAADAPRWRLLLQLDCDEAAGMTWGDLGRLYWWIRDEDLRGQRFERAWTILQCT